MASFLAITLYFNSFALFWFCTITNQQNHQTRASMKIGKIHTKFSIYHYHHYDITLKTAKSNSEFQSYRLPFSKVVVIIKTQTFHNRITVQTPTSSLKLDTTTQILPFHSMHKQHLQT